MPVATLLAVAATFWATHGSPQAATLPAPSWSWGITACSTTSAGCAPGYTINGGPWTPTGNIQLNRAVWDDMTREQKCTLIIHEYGHAILGFGHKDGTVMDPYNAYAHEPGICMQFAPKIRRSVKPDNVPYRGKKR